MLLRDFIRVQKVDLSNEIMNIPIYETSLLTKLGHTLKNECIG